MYTFKALDIYDLTSLQKGYTNSFINRVPYFGLINKLIFVFIPHPPHNVFGYLYFFCNMYICVLCPLKKKKGHTHLLFMDLWEYIKNINPYLSHKLQIDFVVCHLFFEFHLLSSFYLSLLFPSFFASIQNFTVFYTVLVSSVFL